MSIKQSFETTTINKQNHIFSRTRTTIESAFYQNNVQRIDTPAEDYELALNNPNTIVTDQPIIHTEELGLPANAESDRGQPRRYCRPDGSCSALYW